jgi:peptide-methionine (S)-S-oxide reductase
MGGQTESPVYKDICTGTTGHAEVTEVDFDADIISFEALLLIFFSTHNPTTLNRQGNDEGTQYRSVIFYHTDDQRTEAEAMIKRLTTEKVFDVPIVTEIAPASKFYPAENYHQNYFNNNPRQPYCSFVIQPKLNKLAKEFTEKIRPELLQ